MIKLIRNIISCCTINTPEKAYRHAWENGSSDFTRKVSSMDPNWAYMYARNIDGKYTHETMKGTRADDALHTLYCNRFVY